MIKYFCNKCEVEIDDRNEFSRTKFEVGGLTMLLSGDGPWTQEDVLCKYCVIDQLKKLDDRPEEYRAA